MRYDVVCKDCGTKREIAKPMAAAFPACPACGGELRQRFTQVPPVRFNAPGFYATDVAHFRNQVGAERFARFEAQKADIQKRAAAGKLTAYEKALDKPALNQVAQA